jgi:nitrate reductase gamma subunit
MSSEITETEARTALSSIEQRRRQVIAEIDVPSWYWIGLAAGWVALGALANWGPAWSVIVGTVAFGAAHASISSRVLSGRHGSSRLSVGSDMVNRSIPMLVIGFLVVMTVVTVVFALILNADGARNAAFLAGVIVAALVLTGGPCVMAFVRRRAVRRLASA